MRRSISIVLIAILGAGLYLAIVAASGEREAWDSRLYYIAGLPISILLAGFFAWRTDLRARDWLLAFAGGQLLVILTTAGDFNLLPLGVLLMALLTCPSAAIVWLTRRLLSRNGLGSQGDPQ